MRRILRDYFGYEVNFVMNITDVDDKVTKLSPRLTPPSHRELTLSLLRPRSSFAPASPT